MNIYSKDDILDALKHILLVISDGRPSAATREMTDLIRSIESRDVMVISTNTFDAECLGEDA